MIDSFLNRYPVDNVPLVLRLPFLFYGYGLGLLQFLVYLTLRTTVTVNITGREHLVGRANHIFCLWHGYVPLIALCGSPRLSPALGGAPQVWMQHPGWYMKPAHVWLRLLGVKEIILGSTGHSGRQAADRLVDRLRQGYSTVINPDGPQGPPRILKKGVLYLSLESDVPVVALRFSASGCFELNSWDSKRVPRPFTTIEMRISAPIQVTQENFEQAEQLITDALGAE